jgi:hypothetical protein
VDGFAESFASQERALARTQNDSQPRQNSQHPYLSHRRALQNPLDPRKPSSPAFHRAIDVAALIGVRTVSGFAGAVIGRP